MIGRAHMPNAVAALQVRTLVLLGALMLSACTQLTSPPDHAAAASDASMLDAFPPMPNAAAPGASREVRALFQTFNRGINFGNMLEAPREGDWGVRAEDRLIDLIGPQFTQSVRLPVRWSNHASLDASAVIDPAFFERIDYVVDRLLGRGALVILNMHHYRQLDGDALDPDERRVAPELVDVRFLAMWKQIAERYAKRSNRLVFEIYNEPHGRLETRWNELFSRALRLVRQSNPTRAVVVGPTHYNAAHKLAELRLPPDSHLILTVHNYEPFSFTHQGAQWVTPALPVGVACCDPAQRAVVNAALDLALVQAQRLNYPLFVGEFGAYSKASEPARIEYSRFMREAMQARAIPWFYWELASGFGVYDPANNRFRTSLYEALYGS
jgi:endoglucanase